MKPKTVTIPLTAKGILNRLDALGNLASATEWERAAIVYACTTADDRGGNTSLQDHSTVSKLIQSNDLSALKFPLGIRAFAALNRHGLRSTTTVMFYRQRWIDALDKDGGSVSYTFGDKDNTLQLPTIPWKEEDREPSKKRSNSGNPKRKTKEGLDLNELPEDMMATLFDEWYDKSETFRTYAERQIGEHEPVPQEYLDQDIRDMAEQLDASPIRFMRARLNGIHVFESGDEGHELIAIIQKIIDEWRDVIATINDKIAETSMQQDPKSRVHHGKATVKVIPA